RQRGERAEGARVQDAGQAVPDRARDLRPREPVSEEDEQEPEDRDGDEDDADDLPKATPERDAPPGDHVALAELLALLTEQARRLQVAAEQDGDEAAEGRHPDPGQEQLVAGWRPLTVLRPHMQ